MSAELAFMSAVELAQNIRNKQVSSLEATENFFQRIDQLDCQLHSYLTLWRDQAVADARAADAAVDVPASLTSTTLVAAFFAAVAVVSTALAAIGHPAAHAPPSLQGWTAYGQR